MKVSIIAIIIFIFVGCSTLTSYPEHKDQEARFADLENLGKWPITSPIKIYWHDKMIPFIEAQSDEDCAFAVGVVHAHLRLGQMELFKRLSAGRMSESGGPFAVPRLDHLIRTLNLQKSAELSLQRLSKEEKIWLQKYVDGVNFFISKMKDKPVTFKFLNYEPEKWTMLDALRVGRLAAADANWASFFLQLREEPGWDNIWKRYIDEGENSLTSFGKEETLTFNQLLKSFNRSGSNSVVISNKKSNGNGAMIANDPHLGIFMPNLWLLMGYKSPSFHVIGYMLPSTPVVALGRNKEVSWGGTYMRGVSTHLFEVSEEDVISSRTETIKRRFWFDKHVVIRETKKGPILTDHPDFKNSKEVIALGWTGYDGSNEFGSYYKANKSKNFREFRNSFADFAIAGLNITYADDKGNIGLIPAIKQPLLKKPEELTKLIKSRDNYVEKYRGPTELPFSYNPSSGHIVSANNLPFSSDQRIAFVSGLSDRVRRGGELIVKKEKINVDDLKNWQNDVFSHMNFDFNQYLVGLFDKGLESNFKDNLELLKKWDGRYQINQKAPVVYEFLTWEMANRYYQKELKNEKLIKRLLSSDDGRVIFIKDFKAMNTLEQKELVQASLEKVNSEVHEYKNWGEYHVQVARSPLGLIPIFGDRFKFDEYPANGGSTTLNKSAFSPGYGKKEVTFGAQVRHISDMSDPNENYFVMLGGNDGWLNNDNLIDQIKLWRKGDYIKLPMLIPDVQRVYSRKVHTIKAQEKNL